MARHYQCVSSTCSRRYTYGTTTTRTLFFDAAHPNTTVLAVDSDIKGTQSTMELVYTGTAIPVCQNNTIPFAIEPDTVSVLSSFVLVAYGMCARTATRQKERKRHCATTIVYVVCTIYVMCTIYVVCTIYDRVRI